MKLQTKITLISSVFILFIVGLISTMIYIIFYKISTENDLEQLTEQADTIVEALNQNPDVSEKNLLQAFLPSNGMIRIVDEDEKESIPTLTKKEEYLHVPPEFSTQESSEIIKDDEGNYIAIVLKPIIASDGTVVTMQLVNYLQSLTNTMQTLLYVLIGTSIFIMIPTIIGSNVLSRFILRPIKELVHTMRENISEEQWKLIDIKSRTRDELYEMEVTFNDLIRHLKENFQKQEHFVSNASHELKTPIAIIKSYAQLLKRRGETHPEIFKESTEAIDSEADRMEKLIGQMLTLAKRTAVVDKESVNLALLGEQIVHTFQQAYERDIHFDAQSADLTIEANYDQMEQLIYILLDNALKYSEKAVVVAVSGTTQAVCLQVTDYGCGIGEEDQEYIFDRFYRVDKARTRSTGGTGLGLAIAKEITEMHNGTIALESIPNEQTTFTVTFPKIEL